MNDLNNRFLGLAPFLRMSINGGDLTAVGQDLLAKTADRLDDSNLWMNLSIVMLCLGQRDLGLAIQSQALEMSRVYRLASAQAPRMRLLMLMKPGDLSANTPLDCLLEDCDIELLFYYLSVGDEPLIAPIPDHDVLMIAFSEIEENNKLLETLHRRLQNWPAPVINLPLQIANTRRDVASTLLQDIPGLSIPPTWQVSRSALAGIADQLAPLSEVVPECEFPIILRPLDSHGGRGLIKAENSAEIAEYLSGIDHAAFYLSKFVDYSGEDGQFRKFRIALIDGSPFACHMAVSSHWMVHYVNAGMYEDADKRVEERSFMEHFDDFAGRHRIALEEIYRLTGLDYLCIDCAETGDGKLLIFEIDHAMVVHAMDSEELFPHKRIQIEKVKFAFRDFLIRLSSQKNIPLQSRIDTKPIL